MSPDKLNPDQDCCGGGGGCGNCQNSHKHGHDGFGAKILMTLLGVLIVYLTFYVGTLMRNNIRKFDFIGQADSMERVVSISGTGKITARNDIAVTTIGYTNTDADVAKAQAENKKVMDQVYADIKALGIEDKDVTSNYSIYPQYDYTQKGQVFKGYQVSNNVTVKIRDLSKIPSVLGLAGKYGANQVNGLSFTIDDTENLKNQARLLALEDAKRKATVLAERLGVGLDEIISYSDYESSPIPYYKSYGMGGAGNVMMDQAAAPAEVSSGSQDVIINVSVSYKIRQPAW
jgi:uncharacterized protein YggE